MAVAVVAKFRVTNFEPEGYTLYTYGAIQAWAAAGTKGGTTKLDPVIKSLRANKFDTVLGKIGLDAKGDVTAPGYVWYIWEGGSYDYAK
jgi:branched-chain amino acid transport system substrate-binding protein